jgi:hypothetical protein
VGLALLLPIIQIALENEEIASFEISKEIWCLGGQSPVGMLRCPKVIWPYNNPTFRIKRGQLGDDKVEGYRTGGNIFAEEICRITQGREQVTDVRRSYITHEPKTC